MIAINNILVATDFGEASDSALRYGRELAGRFGATLHVLHVAENAYVTTFGAETYAAIVPEMQQEIETAARKRLAEAVIDSDGSGPRTRTVVLALAHIVMGSVAERVVRLAPCPVLTVRHPEHEFVKPDTLQVVATARA